MTENTKPHFNDILNLISELPDYPPFECEQSEAMTYLSDWLIHYSRIFDMSKGFLVNRCALYWAGYDAVDGFDGQAFVDSCQDTNGSLRQLAQILDTDLQIFELDPHNTQRPSIEDIAMAASYGMMGVEESTQLFAACSFGQGVDSISETALQNIDRFQSLEGFMAEYCGLDHAAMMGAAIACLMKGIPMIVEGASGRLTKNLLEKTAGQNLNSIILADDLAFPVTQTPGNQMIATAIALKTLYAGSVKTDCGKVKKAA
jgi:hypothetical protein